MPARSWRTSDWGEAPWMISSVEYSTRGSVWNPPEHAEMHRTAAMQMVRNQQALEFFLCSAVALVRTRILASSLLPAPMFTGTCAAPQSRIENVGRVCSNSLIENRLSYDSPR